MNGIANDVHHEFVSTQNRGQRNTFRYSRSSRVWFYAGCGTMCAQRWTRASTKWCRFFVVAPAHKTPSVATSAQLHSQSTTRRQGSSVYLPGNHYTVQCARFLYVVWDYTTPQSRRTRPFSHTALARCLYLENVMLMMRMTHLTMCVSPRVGWW